MADKSAPGSSPDPDKTAGDPVTDTTSTADKDSAAESSTADAGKTSSEDATSAESSTADKADAKEGSLLDVVKDVLQKGDPGEKSSSPDGKKDAEGTETVKTDDAAKAAAEAEADKPPPFHEHPRWQEKLKEVGTLTEEVKTLKGPAHQYRQIEGFMAKNDLSVDNVVTGLKLMALMTKDPKQAIAQLQNHTKRLQLEVGEILPDDLAEKVEKGFMREEDAKELATKRQETERLSAKAEETTKASEKTEQQRRADFIANNDAEVDKATLDWEKVQISKDPDYQRKQPMVISRVVALTVQRRLAKPKDLILPPEAVAISEQALKDVNEQLKTMLPAPAAARRRPTGNSVSATAKPKNLREAVEQGLQNAS